MKMCGICGEKFIRIDKEFMPGKITSSFCSSCVIAGLAGQLGRLLNDPNAQWDVSPNLAYELAGLTNGVVH